jgi:thioredoxin 1
MGLVKGASLTLHSESRTHPQWLETQVRAAYVVPNTTGAATIGTACRRKFMATKAITDSSFQADVLDSDTPVLVDFWAEWCGPCKMIGPSLEEISAELGEKVVIAKLNIDDNPDAPTKYGVRGIPTMLLFKNGQVAATKVGAAPKSALKGWIESEL